MVVGNKNTVRFQNNKRKKRRIIDKDERKKKKKKKYFSLTGNTHLLCVENLGLLPFLKFLYNENISLVMRLWLSQIVLFCLLAIARGKKNITCGIHCNGYYGTRDLCVNSADQSPQLIKNCNFTSRSQKKKKKALTES